MKIKKKKQDKKPGQPADQVETLYMAKGALRVNARGYWFTGGGEKGSFGFYPHLKTTSNLPVFPDTQVQGDLRMAAAWLKNLDFPMKDELFNKVFGKDGQDGSALLRVGDLTLSPRSLSQWRSDRFQVKARIQIQDATHTVEEHMLMEKELAYLEGLELEAPVYLGYFKREGELDYAKERLEEAAGFLSGFGGGRSRGYGRGEVFLQWNAKNQAISFKSPGATPKGDSFLIFLETLVNFRNKPTEPGGTQHLSSQSFISAEQMEAWLSNMYRRLFKRWPTVEEMSSVRFSYLYPSDRDRRQLGFPPPMTTLLYESGAIRDVWGVKWDEETAAVKADTDERENLFSTKTKPLPSGSFVTHGPEPCELKIARENRLRNAMDGLFVTKKDGLFVQELVRQGTVFGGVLSLDRVQQKEFTDRVLFIVQQVKPIIKGAVFQTHLLAGDREATGRDPEKPHLVIAPLPCLPDFLQRPDNQITQETLRRYSSVLKRPKRNRIVIAPGSVLSEAQGEETLGWSGFGKKTIKPSPAPPVKGEGEKKAPESGKLIPEEILKIIRRKKESPSKEQSPITRAQAGFLRELLHPDMADQTIAKILQGRIEKFDRKEKKDDPMKLLLKALATLPTGDRKALIRAVLDELAECWWKEKKRKEAGGSHENG